MNAALFWKKAWIFQYKTNRRSVGCARFFSEYNDRHWKSFEQDACIKRIEEHLHPGDLYGNNRNMHMRPYLPCPSTFFKIFFPKSIYDTVKIHQCRAFGLLTFISCSISQRPNLELYVCSTAAPLGVPWGPQYFQSWCVGPQLKKSYFINKKIHDDVK